MAAPSVETSSVDAQNETDNITEEERTLLSGSYPSVVERYFTAGYKVDMNGNRRQDFCILKHSNKICLITLARSHPLLSDNKTILKVDFQVGANINRMENKVVGKRKKGGQWLNQTAQLCKITCSDSTCYTMYSCINAKLVEVNERLLTDPQVIQRKPSSEGYIAIVQPKLANFEQQMEQLLSPAQYEAALKARLDADEAQTAGEAPQVTQSSE